MRRQETIRVGGDGNVAARDSVLTPPSFVTTAGAASPAVSEPPPAGTIDTLVRAMPRDELAVLWRRRWRRQPPKGLSRRLLEYHAAWLLQAEASGGLTAATRRRLDTLAGADRSSGDGGAERKRHRGKVDPTTPRRALRPGSRLIRQWQGRSHVVEVIKGGFAYEGQSYTSLTAIAFEITGARWSGPRFFGLNAASPDRMATRDQRERRTDGKRGPTAAMHGGTSDG